MCLGIYGFILLPAGWNSALAGTATTAAAFANDLEQIRHSVGDWNYFALAMFVVMQFSVAIGVSSVPYFLMSEVFSFR